MGAMSIAVVSKSEICGTSASLLGTSALLVVTMFARNKMFYKNQFYKRELEKERKDLGYSKLKPNRTRPPLANLAISCLPLIPWSFLYCLFLTELFVLFHFQFFPPTFRRICTTESL